MLQNDKNTQVGSVLSPILILSSVLFLKIGFISDSSWYWGLAITLPLLVITLIDARLKKNDNSNASDEIELPHLLTQNVNPEGKLNSGELAYKNDDRQHADTGKGNPGWPYVKKTQTKHHKIFQHLN